MPTNDRSGIDGAALRAAVVGPETDARDVLLSAERTLHALELIARAPGPLPAKAVAQALGISLGTSYRVLHTLEGEGYVVRLSHGCYGLADKLPSLSRAFRERLDPLPTIRSVMEDLAAAVEEDVYLAVLRGGEIAVAEVVERSRELHIDGLGVGFSRVAHASAIGKVLLAFSAPETMDDYLDERRLDSYTRRTLVQRRHIKRNLATVRESGVGCDLEELLDGCCCVAAPVLDAGGRVVGAIGLSAPARRWGDQRPELTRLCTDAAARASHDLGHREAAAPPA
jgi:DNA-binding IclR family transcriptional regulator